MHCSCLSSNKYDRPVLLSLRKISFRKVATACNVLNCTIAGFGEDFGCCRSVRIGCAARRTRRDARIETLSE